MSLFDKIKNAKPVNYSYFSDPREVSRESIDVDLSERLARNKSQKPKTLKEAIDTRRLALAYKSEGLEQLLDLTPIDKGEFLIYCRKVSMLQAMIQERLLTRTPEEAVQAMIAATVKGYCKTCFETCQNCQCSVADKQWV